jgi:aminoglycoside/choline kinase family phosphotransferase
MRSDERLNALCQWAQAEISRLLQRPLPEPPEATSLGGDASFRRYFRYVDPLSGQSWLLVDAPPPHEDVGLFVRVATEFHATGMRTPVIHAADPELGFMLLEDFGDRLFLPQLLAAQQSGELADANTLYQAAMGSLLDLQQGSDKSQLPSYDAERLLNEMRLFDQWFCGEMLGLALDDVTQSLLSRTWQYLIDAATAQPQVRVHRDYHSRNLMIVDDEPGNSPGVIDFQDAVVGPITYDLVSLLKDCYIVWPASQVKTWLSDYYQQASERSLLPQSLSFDVFCRDFDLMGLQRHIKVLGIFCRLALRDGKRGYLGDLPVVLGYVQQTARVYPQLDEFAAWFERVPLPLIQQHLKQELS